MRISLSELKGISIFSLILTFGFIIAGCTSEDGNYSNSAVESRLLQINTTLERLIGKISPINPDEDFVTQIKNLQVTVEGTAAPNLTREKVSELQEQLDKTLSQMPPLAQESLLSEIILINWSLEALTVLHDMQEPMPLSLLTIQTILNSGPEMAPPIIVNSLQDRLTSLKENWLADTIQSESSNAESLDQIRNVLAGVNFTEGERIRLTVAILKSEAKLLANIDDLRVKHSTAEYIYESAVPLYTAIANSTASSVDGLEDLKKVITQCELVFSEVENDKLKREEKRLRKYQRWALQNIDSFQSYTFDRMLLEIRNKLDSFAEPKSASNWELCKKFPALAQKIESDNPGLDIGEDCKLSTADQNAIYNQAKKMVGWSNDKELAAIALREAIIKYFMPIDDRYLMPVVGKYYAQQFDEAMSFLKGTDHYLYVLKKTIVVERKSPTEIN